MAALWQSHRYCCHVRRNSAVWQRTLVSDQDALFSCLVWPGRDPEDFELSSDR
jgi:hypothetical protein